MLSQRVIELRCERCQSSFAPGTRRCVHCGGRLVPGRVLGATPPEAPPPMLRTAPSGGAVEAPRAVTAPAPGGPTGDEAADDEQLLPRRVHNIIWVVTAIFVILGSILGRC